MAETSESRTFLVIRNAVILFAGLLGLTILIRLVFSRSYNYDELQHAHLTWLVSVGEVPYRDFADNHFPFLWILMSPLIRVLPESPMTLIVLRGLSLLLNAVFIGVLGALICLDQEPKQMVWAATFFGLVVFSPLAMHYLIEFRPDPLANVLLFSALAWLRLRGLTNTPTAFVSGFCIGVAVLVNTKCALFPFVLGVVALVLHFRKVWRIWPFVLAICFGFAAALLCGILLSAHMSIPLDDAWRMVVSYNVAVEKARPFGFGLADSLMKNPLWLAYVLVGLIGCAGLFLRHRERPGLLAIAIFLFLLVNAATTTRPWKQYVVSWLLLAAYFPARSLSVFAARLSLKGQVVAALCVLAMVSFGFVRCGVADPNGAESDRATQNRVIDWIIQRVPSDGFVVASFPLHPVFRRDTFFKVVFDLTQHGGDGLERFMPQLVPDPYGEHFRESGYKKELDARPPAVMMIQGFYTLDQAHALDAYVSRDPNSYILQEIPGTSVRVVIRKTGSFSDSRW
jgi:hypothetical protein